MDTLSTAHDPDFPARAIIAGEAPATNDDIDAWELDRARHALAYLKQKLGNQALRDLLCDDLARMTAQVRAWVQASGGAWQTGCVELIVPGPSAQEFRAWYDGAMANAREPELRAGHPEHLVSHPEGGGTIEVVENIGETELPWRVFYRSLPQDAAYPSAWDPRYPVHFGAELVDAEGLRVGFSMRELRDADNGLHLKLTSHLPAAAPRELLRRHLHHFSIEYRNWARFAWLQAGRTAQPTVQI